MGDHRRDVAWLIVAEDDPAHSAVLDELLRDALTTFGEERAAEVTLQSALRAAATAIWRVCQESLEPSDHTP